MICEKCGNQFSRIIEIDGKKRNLQHRKQCLTCSPFGSSTKGKEKKVRKPNAINEKVCVCSQCHREFIYKRSSGHSIDICNTCRTANKRYRIKERCVDYKGGKCQICGYNKCIRVLSFHHLYQKDKRFNISENSYAKWEIIQAELDKCILVCANCHGEIHDGLHDDFLLKYNNI